MAGRRTRGARWAGLALLAALGCRADAAPSRAPQLRPAEPIPDSTFAALVARLSEPGGYFDTDNLISNESAYLKVVDAMEALDVHGGAYVGVGPDQSFSYVAHVRPEVAFIVDIRRDNLLQHLLLKALVERAPTRVEFLSGLHGRTPPEDPASWRNADVDQIVAYVDGAPKDPAAVDRLHDEVERAVVSYGVPLSADDLVTIRRFHQAFIDAGLGLRFTSYGRAPRPYYPTYRQLVLETDMAGEHASYLGSSGSYDVVRALEIANRIIPVVGDLAGDHAVREIGAVMREMGLSLSAFYVSNVEFYLWGPGTIDAWIGNVGSLPAAENAVVIRSYFPNSGARHPSSVPGYYATQTLQPVAELVRGGFGSYWELVTRGVIDLRAPAGVR